MVSWIWEYKNHFQPYIFVKITRVVGVIAIRRVIMTVRVMDHSELNGAQEDILVIRGNEEPQSA